MKKFIYSVLVLVVFGSCDKEEAFLREDAVNQVLYETHGEIDEETGLGEFIQTEFHLKGNGSFIKISYRETHTEKPIYNYETYEYDTMIVDYYTFEETSGIYKSYESASPENRNPVIDIYEKNKTFETKEREYLHYEYAPTLEYSETENDDWENSFSINPLETDKPSGLDIRNEFDNLVSHTPELIEE
ncbi:hypothetical protein [Flammeovirga sp. SubArs3]|uniref:hypothetical protein n=1 Tax=Flammeovirga sp. SubArs3 TaxID=2995316 RepID=UPI00248B8798|nr:hypothetical protein [Flammeovirga sp. SubArs3]